jgi:PleD family two-component response regulator
MVHDSLVYRPSSSAEAIIQRTIGGIQRMMSLHNTEGEKGTTTRTEEVIEISLAAKRHWELQIKILRDTPRDAEKVREILNEKQEEYEEAEDSEDIERLIPEIEMLKFVLFLVSRNKDREEQSNKAPC